MESITWQTEKACPRDPGAYVGLQNRALLAEVRRELVELENRINETYVRKGACALGKGHRQERLDVPSQELSRIGVLRSDDGRLP